MKMDYHCAIRARAGAMAVVKHVDGRVIREDRVGSSIDRLCYPGVSSCISITGVSVDKMIGAHLTIGTTVPELAQFIALLAAEKTSEIMNFYVVGKIAKFKESTTIANFNTRKKMRDFLKAQLEQKANVYFCDIGLLVAQGANVCVFRNGAQASFSYIPEAGNLVVGSTYPNTVNYIEIPKASLLMR
jgi:hypothetical protein